LTDGRLYLASSHGLNERTAMDLDDVRNETAELFQDHDLEADDLTYVTEELVQASADAADETDGEKGVDESGVGFFTVNGHNLLYCPAGSRTYICYSPDCNASVPRRRLRSSSVFRIEHIGYCRVPTRKYKMFVRRA
jgi:hypothetical protein